MTGEQVKGLIGSIGLVSQLGGCVLLVALFTLLRPHARRRRYFAVWGQAWMLLTLAIGALVARYLFLPHAPPGGEFDELSAPVRALYLAYQLCKLVYYGFLVAGVRMYARGARPDRFMERCVAAAVVYAGASVSLAPGLNDIVAAQAPVGLAALGYCALTLLRLPPSRRSVGSKAAGTFFAMTAALWLLYFVAFATVHFDGSRVPRPLAFVAFYNSYLDLLLQMLMGYGMVVLLMEDAKRQVDDAHTELAIAHDRLRRNSLYDALTGALNRRAFEEGVGLDAAKATFGTVMMLDLDNLKTVNDQFGHGAGDALLQHLVSALGHSLRVSDRVYRWGGDEFLVLLPGAKASDARQRVRSILAAAPPRAAGGVPDGLRLLVSCGAAEYAGAEELPAAVARADQDMYDEKHRRRADAARVGAQAAA